MLVKVPYGKETMTVDVNEANVADILSGNDVFVSDETETIRKAIDYPIHSENLRDFLADAKDVLFIVNDATRPTPTAQILEAIHEMISHLDVKFLVATGAHRAPTEEEYNEIFGSYYAEFKSCIYAHDSRADKDMVYVGKTRKGTEIYFNRLGMEAHKTVIIGSVEPHYCAGYTGGRKAYLPGIASYKTIEQNHRFTLSPQAKALALEGNPLNEDMKDAMRFVRGKEVFSIMTVLDRNHRIYAVTAGDIHDSFMAAVGKAKEVFAVKIREKADIVISVARYPMDINLYQSQKAIDNGKLALKEGGILILVSKCRQGIGDETFTRFLQRYDRPGEVLRLMDENYVLGYHKAAKLAELMTWADIYAVTDLPDDLLRSIFFIPFQSLQEALNHAISAKGKNARVLFLLDGSMTVPTPDLK